MKEEAQQERCEGRDRSTTYSIVREYQTPAVVTTGDCTNRLEVRQVVAVDDAKRNGHGGDLMQRESTRGRGWLLVAVVAGLVLLTGIYPLVAEPENRVMAATMVGVAAIVLAVSAGPLRRGEPTAWKLMWLFPAFLALMAVFIAIRGDGTFGFVYLVFAVVAGLGLRVSRPDRAGSVEKAT